FCLFHDRPPPSPTLFPYTTLFRSAAGGMVGAGRDRDLAGENRREVVGPDRRVGRTIAPVEVDVGDNRLLVKELPGAERRDGGAADRKSTRLNSSHLGISYAVFCLK